MGYKPQRRLYKLTFEDYDGLEVAAYGLSMGSLLEIQELSEQRTQTADAAQAKAATTKMMTIFGESLESWNVDGEDGEPLPRTVDGMKTLEPDFLMSIIQAWTQAIAGVNAPLGGSSPSGEKFPEELIPMEASSPGLQSSNELSS